MGPEPMNVSTSSGLHQGGCISTRRPRFQQSFRNFLSGAVENSVHNCPLHLSCAFANPMIARHGPFMPKRRYAENQNLLFFPDLEDTATALSAYGGINTLETISASAATLSEFARSPGAACDIVISGSYRKDFESIRQTFEEFRDLGCTILSPSNVSIVSEQDGFVYMKGEEAETPENIEDRHLKAIQKANFVWLHTPEGYVGPSAALEVGFAHAAGVPVYTKELPNDKTLQSFVQVVASPSEVLNIQMNHQGPPAPALKAFQEYYRRAALKRGYAKEGPKDCLLLMVEEVGELARALRKREKLVRHGSYPDSSEAHELADVFLYVVHMANVLDLDLANIIRDKEIVNLQKFLAR